jgi:peptide/nickel transport system substrate-binding protein
LRIKTRARLAAVIAVLAVILAACGGGGTGGQQPQQQAEQPRQGGTLIIAAEQEGDCLDLLGSCSSASWLTWWGYINTIPRVFDLVDGKYLPSVWMDGEPQLQAGPPMQVTYKIKQGANWDDGTAISSADFQYTYNEIMNGKDISSRLGYDKIEKVDAPDPATAVVTFKEPYAAWKDLFGLFYGILPSHILQGKDRGKEMGTGYKFSAGPFKIESWTKGQEAVLVPNPNFIGKKPYLDRVVFKFITETGAELQAVKTGQVHAAQPQEQLDIRPQLEALPNAQFIMNNGTNMEGLWINAKKAPLDSKPVRQALAYAIDREAIVQQLMRPIYPDAQVLQSFALPGTPQFNPAFEVYKHDPAKVESLMTGDGWAKGGDGIWAKGSQKAAIEISTTAGNKRRELVEQLLQSQLKANGFDLKVNNTEAGTLFGQWLPKGQHVIGMYAQVLTNDPTFCDLFCSTQIPGPANGGAGQNYQFHSTPAIDQPWEASERELDSTKLAELVKQGNTALADEVVAIPLYLRLSIVVYDKNKVGGPINTNPIMGAFNNLNEWWLKQ